MEKPLYIPDSKSYPGLRVFCNKCKADVTGICKRTGKPIQRCEFGHKHRFKLYIHQVGTLHDRITKTLDTRNLDEAIAESIQLKKKLESKTDDNIQQKQTEEIGIEPKTEPIIKKEKATPKPTVKQPQLLLEIQSRYMGFLMGDKEICPAYMYRPRSNQHLSDISRGMTCLIDALKESGHQVHKLKLADIDKHAIGIFYDYMHKKELSGSTVNRYLGYFTAMYKWLITQEGYQIQNIFESVRRHSVKAQDVQSITKEELSKVLKAMRSKELGKQELNGGVIKYLWKPWLIAATRLALYSGRRAAELFYLRFSSIILEKGEMAFIKSEDIKVNKIKNLQDDNKKYVSIPITAELKKLLLELGYNKNKGTEKYIIANEERMQRDTMARLLWAAFGHYAEQAGVNKTFKSLRKTHASALAAKIGAENARIITGHSGLKVLEDHYLDKKVIGKVASNFGVFEKRA